MGHGHTYQFQGWISDTGRGGLGCVSCSTIEEALKDYWRWLYRLNYKLTLRDGTEYYPQDKYKDDSLLYKNRK